MTKNHPGMSFWTQWRIPRIQGANHQWKPTIFLPLRTPAHSRDSSSPKNSFRMTKNALDMSFWTQWRIPRIHGANHQWKPTVFSPLRTRTHSRDSSSPKSSFRMTKNALDMSFWRQWRIPRTHWTSHQWNPTTFSPLPPLTHSRDSSSPKSSFRMTKKNAWHVILKAVKNPSHSLDESPMKSHNIFTTSTPHSQ